MQALQSTYNSLMNSYLWRLYLLVILYKVTLHFICHKVTSYQFQRLLGAFTCIRISAILKDFCALSQIILFPPLVSSPSFLKVEYKFYVSIYSRNPYMFLFSLLSWNCLLKDHTGLLPHLYNLCIILFDLPSRNRPLPS